MNQCDTYLLSSNGDVLKSISTKTPTTGVVLNHDTPKNNEISNHETNKEGDKEKQQQQPDVVEEEYSSSSVTVDQYGEIIYLPSFDYSYIVDSPTTSVGERKHLAVFTTTPTTDVSANAAAAAATKATIRNKSTQETLLQSIVEVPSPVDSCSSCCSNASPPQLTNHTSNNKFNFTRDTTTTASSLPQDPGSATTDISTTMVAAATTTAISSTTNNNSTNNGQHKQQRPMIPGIPQKVSFFQDLRVTTISTHPMGNHVLFISSEGLLFAFGDNTFGQCGVGATPIPYITEPTMVTAFLENGGKASAISAGVDYSLVVVRTNLERIEKLLRSKHQQNSTTGRTILTTTHSNSNVASTTINHHPPPSSIVTTATTTSLASGSSTGSGSMMTHVGHHQMYAFGNNEGDKLGLINGKTPLVTTNTTKASPNYRNNNHNIAPLPRRVALHSKIFSDEDYNMTPRRGKRRNGSTSTSTNANPNAWFHSATSEDFPSPGIFCVEASQYHSMALVHLPDGTIELYSWGISPSVEYGALGCTSSFTEDTLTSLTTTPTVVLTSRPAPCSSRSRKNDNNDFPLRLALGLHCSCITYKSGQVLSMGFSSDGLLGLGPGIFSAPHPTPIVFEKSTNSGSNVIIRQVSVGHRHAVAISSAGKAYSWGLRANGRLGQGNNYHNSSPHGRSDPRIHGREEESSIVWTPQLVAFEHGSNSEYNNDNNVRGSTKVYRAAAGPDASIFIMSDGQVLSCGKQSGQLGQGTVTSDSMKLTPMFGGLYLWKDEEEHHHQHNR
jgi:alpha-tubulin suppressor-like RCC1 family protein